MSASTGSGWSSARRSLSRSTSASFLSRSCCGRASARRRPPPPRRSSRSETTWSLTAAATRCHSSSTSVQFASGTAVFAFAIGATLAWMNERTNTPFKTVFFALSLIPLVIPSILFTVAWILLASPQIGIINLVVQGWLGLEEPLFDVYSMPGMIWVDGLHYSPMAFLLMSAAFRAMDPSLEESATMSGAGMFQVLRRVTLRLTWPADCRHHPDPVRPGHRVVRGARATGAAVGHRCVHCGDLSGRAPLSEPDRPGVGVRTRTSDHHDRWRLLRFAPVGTGIEVRHDDRQRAFVHVSSIWGAGDG